MSVSLTCIEFALGSYPSYGNVFEVPGSASLLIENPQPVAHTSAASPDGVAALRMTRSALVSWDKGEEVTATKKEANVIIVENFILSKVSCVGV